LFLDLNNMTVKLIFITIVKIHFQAQNRTVAIAGRI